MKRIAKFHKVSFEQFKKGWMGEFPQTTEAKLQKIYEDIKLPKRATAGSAGYDFYTPETFSLKSGETIKIPTRDSCRDGRRMGAEVIPSQRPGIQIPPAAGQ